MKVSATILYILVYHTASLSIIQRCPGDLKQVDEDIEATRRCPLRRYSHSHYQTISIYTMQHCSSASNGRATVEPCPGLSSALMQTYQSH